MIFAMVGLVLLIRKIIESKKEWFTKKHRDKPQHANVIYDKFYSVVNGGNW